MELEFNKYLDKLIEITVEYGMKILGAAVVLIVGLWLVRILSRTISRTMEKRNIDPSLQPFLKSLISAILKVLLAITVMSMLGIEMTSFVAILGAAGLAVGLALSGTLQNFAGGVMILILKPFKVGDLIEAKGFTGTVKEIQIFHTILNTVDNKMVIIPNNGLATDAIINYTGEEIRRVDFKFGISYGENLDKAKAVILDIVSNDKRILQEPPPFARLGEMADSSLNLTTRLWVKTEDYWDVFFDMNEKVYEAFQKNGITIPFPQMDVHLHNKS